VNAILFVVGLVHSAGFVVAAIAAVFCLVFEKAPTQMELERASMRSMSWPTDRRRVSR
jgi:hypothetical protein